VPRRLDFAHTRAWRFKKYRFRTGLCFYNIFDERSIGITFGSVR